MNKNILRETIDKDLKPANFIYNEFGRTVQMSHVRFVYGKKSEFVSIEDFYWKLVLNQPKNAIIDPSWYILNKIIWIDDLKINKSKPEKMYDFIKNALIFIIDERRDNQQMEEERITRNIKLPKKIDKCWNIIDTKSIDNERINSFIAECEDEYCYIEELVSS